MEENENKFFFYYRENTRRHNPYGREMREIPWMSTNYISQWCLNTVMLLEFARDAMPSLAEAEEICREAYRLEL